MGLRLVGMFAVIFVVLLAIGIIYIVSTTVDNLPSAIGLIVVAVVILGIVIGMRLVRQIKEYEQVLQSIRFGVEADRITRHQMRIKDETIASNEVFAIQESEDGLLVLTRERERYIFVPRNVTNYGELRKQLSAWRGIQQTQAPAQTKGGALSAVWAVGTLVCVGLLLFAQELWQVVVAGGLTLAIYVLSYRMLRQSGAVSARFQRTYEGVLLFLTIIVLVKVLIIVFPMIRP